jgi:hypothetical protein
MGMFDHIHGTECLPYHDTYCNHIEWWIDLRIECLHNFYWLQVMTRTATV